MSDQPNRHEPALRQQVAQVAQVPHLDHVGPHWGLSYMVLADRLDLNGTILLQDFLGLYFELG
jgi:hypothetical protein